MRVVKSVSFISLASFLIGGWLSHTSVESPVSQASHSIYAEPLDIEITYDEEESEVQQENKDVEHEEKKKKQTQDLKNLNHSKNLQARLKMDIVLGKNGAKIFRKLSKERFRSH